MKHVNGIVCPRCKAMMEEAHEDIRYWFYQIVEQFPETHASCVWRGKDDQEKAIAEKKSLLKWPLSKHNFMLGSVPRSKAMDLFRLTDEGKAEFRVGFYVAIANWLEDRSAPIFWGGLWVHFKDHPHFELKE